MTLNPLAVFFVYETLVKFTSLPIVLPCVLLLLDENAVLLICFTLNEWPLVDHQCCPISLLYREVTLLCYLIYSMGIITRNYVIQLRNLNMSAYIKPTKQCQMHGKCLISPPLPLPWLFPHFLLLISVSSIRTSLVELILYQLSWLFHIFFWNSVYLLYLLRLRFLFYRENRSVPTYSPFFTVTIDHFSLLLYKASPYKFALDSVSYSYSRLSLQNCSPLSNVIKFSSLTCNPHQHLNMFLFFPFK